MRIEYYHASRYGNGEKVANEFKRLMKARGVTVNVHHIKGSKPKDIPRAELYIFSSPGRMGSPRWCMKRFLKKVRLPSGSRYAILTTEGSPQPDKKTGKMPSKEEQEKWQRIIPRMNEVLAGKGLVKVAEDKVLVTGMMGPLEEGWERKVEAFADRILP